jgi:hypothetical protein
LVGVALTLSSLPASLWWDVITGPLIGALVLVIAWSAYIDYWFCRGMLGASRGGAIRDVAALRALTWPIVFVLFSVPVLTPGAIGEELSESIQELMR